MMFKNLQSKKFNILGAVCLVLLFVTIRWINLVSMTQSRQIPIEGDDTFSYIFHAKALENTKSINSSNFFNSFNSLEKTFEEGSELEFYRKRFYHRIKTFYHLGHALYLKSIKNILDVDYIQAYVFSTYLLNLLLLLALVGICYSLCDLSTAYFAGAIFVFSFWVVPHQITAAPREWINLFYYVLISSWLFDLSFKKFVFLQGLLLISMSIFHSLGKQLIYIYLCLCIIFLMFNPARKKAFVVLCLSLVSLIINFGLFETLGLEIGGKHLSYQVKFSILEGIKNFFISFYQFPFSISGVLKVILHSTVFFLPMIGIIYFILKKNYKASIIVLFGIGPFWGLSFIGVDYRPAMDTYFLSEYLMSSALLICSTLFALFLSNTLKKVGNRYLTVFSYLGVFLMLISVQYSTKNKRFIDYHVMRQSYFSPIPFMEGVEKQLNENDCVIFDDEYMLYAYYTFRSQDRKVALLVDFGQRGGLINYSSTDYLQCPYLISTDHAKNLYKTIYSLDNYYLYKNPYN